MSFLFLVFGPGLRCQCKQLQPSLGGHCSDHWQVCTIQEIACEHTSPTTYSPMFTLLWYILVHYWYPLKHGSKENTGVIEKPFNSFAHPSNSRICLELHMHVMQP